MEARATAKYIRGSAQKIRLVVDLIRGKSVSDALTILQFTKKRCSKDVEKVLKSAVANAEQKPEGVDADSSFVSQAYVNEGARMKRVRPAPMGRAYRIQRRMSHISIHVSDK
jgi:large subunit ribosomal protein L22